MPIASLRMSSSSSTINTRNAASPVLGDTPVSGTVGFVDEAPSPSQRAGMPERRCAFIEWLAYGHRAATSRGILGERSTSAIETGPPIQA